MPSIMLIVKRGVGSLVDEREKHADANRDE